MNDLDENDRIRAVQIESDASDNPEAKLQSKERLAFVQKALAQLGAEQRTAIILHKFENLSYKEIAAIMGTSVNSVESRLFRAKQNLYKILKAHI